MATPWKRLFQNWFTTRRAVHSAFPAKTRLAIEEATRQAELGRHGELRFVAEASLHSRDIWRGLSARDRAIDLFGLLRMWDTERRNGVLIYLLLAEHRIELVADRGLAGQIPQSRWDELCREMETAFRDGEFERGAVQCVERVAKLMAQVSADASEQSWHAQASQTTTGELSNQPLVLPE